MAIDFNMCFNEYINSTDKNNTRIISDFNQELALRNDYRGREIYELLQNAEDAGAEANAEVEVIIDYSDGIISITNIGGKPFSDEGFTSLLRANQSSKTGKNLIGKKGLGFRSILNWAKEIEIHSNNYKCTFSEEIAIEKWKKIQTTLESKIGKENTNSIANEMEKIAKENEINCPIAILPLPRFERTHIPNDYTTKITIKIKENIEILDSIKDQLYSIDERGLLFLTWIKSIHIKGNEIDNRVITCDKSKWLFHSNSGFIDGKEYSIILAYPKKEENLTESNPLYSFFPTKINIKLPIIIHATFELTMSRNGLVENNTNKAIEKYVAKSLIDFAEQELAELYSTPSWAIYNAIDTDNDLSIWNLTSTLKDLKEQAKIYPTINGTYERLSDSYYYSDDFSEYVMSLKNKGWNHFEKMLIGDKPIKIKNTKGYSDSILKDIINQLSNWITTIEERCNLIQALKQLNTYNKFDLLLDQNGELISTTETENVYINTGKIPNKLPSNFRFRFVNEELIEYLINNIPEVKSLGRDNQKRNLSNYLSNICKVTTSDIFSVKNELKKYSKLISQEDNFELREQHYREFLECLQANQELFSAPQTITDDPWILKAQDGSFQPAYSLIIKPHKAFDGVNKYLLEQSYFDTNNINDDFYYNVLNISKYFPLENMDFNNDFHFIDFCAQKEGKSEITTSNCRNSNKKKQNQSLIISDEYISNITLTDLVISIHQDDFIKQILFEKIEVHYFYYTEKQCSIEQNYAMFNLLKRINCSKYITSEKINFLGDTIDYNSIVKYNIQPTEINSILIKLGAKDDFRFFSIPELYEILHLIYQNPQYKDGKGVQSLYKKIREAIFNKIADKDDTQNLNQYKKDLFLYSKTHKRYLACNELYYWDNDMLPKSMLDGFPKLDIGSRVGEESVKKIFFVRTPSIKEYSLVDKTINDYLQKELNDWISERITFIYANCTKNVRSQDTSKRYSSRLKSLNIVVCSKCSFKHIEYETILEMNNNEIMPLNGNFYFKSDYINISDATKDPQFWNSLTEIFCLILNISKEETYRTIREILRNDINFNRTDIENYLSPEDWEKACNEMGVSDAEYLFWEKIVGKDTFNRKLFIADKFKYIEQQIGINISDIYDSEIMEFNNMISNKKIKLYERIKEIDTKYEIYQSYFKQDFIERYKRILIEQRNISKNSYTKWLYKEYKGNQSDFLNMANTYMEEWIENIEFENRYYSDYEIKEIFLEEIKKRFQFEWNGETINSSLSILPQYIEILNKYNISEDDLRNDKNMYSICFFTKNETEIEKWAKDKYYVSYDKNEELQNTSSIIPITIVESPIELVNRKPIISNSSNYVGKTKRVISDKEKSKIGKQNEIHVYNSMMRSCKFTDVIGISRNIDPINGNDNAHYDISYKELSELNNVRYLEVKTANHTEDGYSFLMSSHEYEFAMKHLDYYDIALVINKETIKICKALFKNKPIPATHTYEVTINIHDIECSE